MSPKGVSQGAAPGRLLRLFVCSLFEPVLRSHLESSGWFGLFLIELQVCWLAGQGCPSVRPACGARLRARCQCQLWLQLIFLEIKFTSCKSYQEKLLGNFFFPLKKKKEKKNPFQFLASLKIVKFLPPWLLGGCQKGRCYNPFPV